MYKIKLFFSSLLLLLLGSVLQAQTTTGLNELIPKPISVQENKGVFTFYKNTALSFPAALSSAAGLLKSQLSNFEFSSSKNKTRIQYVLLKASEVVGKEGYKLSIQPNQIIIAAQTVQGAILGTSSLVQLQMIQQNQQQISCGIILDSPRFAYRGMHLDVSRNFFPLSFIKKYIDLMSLYKFNTFHWHLTDGPGWRLEIKKYPKLTQMGAFRAFNSWKSWWDSERLYTAQGDAGSYGGFYTQVQAKEIVKYAASKGITVIPEIEMPGHTEEVLAAYPELACSGKPYQGGAFCVGNEKTFEFLENVLTEVMDIFPSTFIHIGGDEVGKADWKKCPKCQALKNKASLKDENELQSYFVKRIEKFLNQHQRNLLGWDEIIEGGLSPNATVMSWRGDKGAITAATQKHEVVMTPGVTYFDAYQSNPETQPLAIGGYLPIKRVYNFEPIPAGLNKESEKYIIGTQGNLWSEYLPTTYQVEYMAYPRAIALAEVAWTQKDKKNYDDFTDRLQHQYLLLQRLHVNYYRPSTFVEIVATPDYTIQKNLIQFNTEMYHPEIRYTLDGSEPNLLSSKYEQPFLVEGTTNIKARVVTERNTLSAVAQFTANYHKAIGKKVTYNTRWSESYPAQKLATLTNGIVGSITYGDGQWLGYTNNLDITLDMDSVTMLHNLGLRFMQQTGPGVYMPGFVSVSLSQDGDFYSEPIRVMNDISTKDSKLIFKSFDFDLKGQPARYIRIKAFNEQRGFLFVDEVIVN